MWFSSRIQKLIPEIVSSYEDRGLSCIAISKNLELNKKTVSKVLNCHSIKKRGKGKRGKDHCNWRGCGDISSQYFTSIKIAARNRGIEFSLSIEYFWSLFLEQNKKCHLSGIDLYFGDKQNASLDRIDPNKGYLEGNVQWVHVDINIMKVDLPQNVFIQMCRSIAVEQENNTGLLFNTRAYLAGNMEYGSDIEDWRDDLTLELEALGVIALDPTKDMFLNSFKEDEGVRQELKKWREDGDFDKVREFMKKVVQKDLRMVDICDFGIFKIEYEKPTFGTIHEFVNCTIDRKPILLIVKNKNEIPLWLLRYVDPNMVFNSISEVKIFLNKVNDGEIVLDDRFWKILKPAYRSRFSLGNYRKVRKKC